MGPAGAAAVALLAAVVAGLGALLVAAASRGTRAASSRGPARVARLTLPTGLALLALGLLLPKATLRSLEFETTGRLAMLLFAVVGSAAALAAWRRHEPGSRLALAAHLYFVALAASPVGEAIFAVFRTL